MKKTFKKLVSLFAMLCLLCTSLPAFAATDATGVTEFENGVEYYRSLTALATTNSNYYPWRVGSGGSVKVTGGGESTNSDLYMLYKLPLPSLSENQVISSYKFSFATNTYTGDQSSSYRIYGPDVDYIDAIKDLSTFSTAYSGFSAIKSNSVMTGIEALPVGDTEYYYYLADISAYANEAYLKGQSYFYILVTSASTLKLCWNATYYDAELKPSVYFTTGDSAETLALSSTNIASHQLDVDLNDPIVFYYNKPIAAATATVNDTAANCTIAKGKVTVDAALAENTEYDVAISVTDYADTALDSALDFATYEGEIITANPYKVSATGSTELTSGHASVPRSGFAFYKLPFPELEPGQKIEKYIFRHIPAGNSPSLYGRYVGLPWVEESKLTSITTADEAIAPVMNVDKDKVDAEYMVEDSITAWATGYVPRYDNVKAYVVNVDLTTYANDCYNTGQRGYFLLGYNNRYTAEVYPSNYTNLTKYGYYNGFYYVLGDADPLAIANQIPEDGSTVASETVVSFDFNNGISVAAATVNGEAINCTIDGTNVTVDIDLLQYEDYTITLNVADIYDQSMEKTISFSTVGENGYGAFNDGLAYHITATADPAEVIGKVNIDARSSHAILYRIPVPTIPQGQVLDTFTFRMVNYSQNAFGAYKLPGDAWELTEDTDKDGQMMRFADEDLQACIDASNSLKLAKITDITPSSNSAPFFLNEFDITDYANECIARDESYIDIVARAGASTMDAYGFETEHYAANYRANYEYTTLIPEFKGINAAATVSGATLKALSFDFLTSVENLGEKLVIRDAETKAVVDADFTNTYGEREVALAAAVELGEDKAYEVVLLACTDAYGNEIDPELVIFSFETGKKYEASSVKIVADESTAAYDDAEGLTTVTAGSAYRAISKATNNTGALQDFVVAIAQYKDDELISLSFTPVSVAAETPDFGISSDALTISADADEVKAFVWLDANNKPLVEELIVGVN